MALRKEGSAHIEMIFAFIVFVGFVLFMNLVLQPKIELGFSQESTLLNLKNSFFENVSGNVSLVLVMNKTFGGVATFCQPRELKGNAISFSTLNNGFYYVSISEEFRDVLSECPAGQNYTLGSVEVKAVVLNSSIYKLKEDYEKNYDALKVRFNVPSSTDFYIRVSEGIDNSGKYNPVLSLDKPTSEGTQVESFSYYEPFLYSNGTIKICTFTIGVW